MAGNDQNPTPNEAEQEGWNEDIPPSHRPWNSDYDVGADHFPDGHTIRGHDPIALARKWGSNPTGQSRSRRPSTGKSTDFRADPEPE